MGGCLFAILIPWHSAIATIATLITLIGIGIVFVEAIVQRQPV
jgi:hypothetical protein